MQDYLYTIARLSRIKSSHSQRLAFLIAITRGRARSLLSRGSPSILPTRLASRASYRHSLTSLSNRISRRVLSRLTRCNPIHSLSRFTLESSRSSYPSHFPLFFCKQLATDSRVLLCISGIFLTYKVWSRLTNAKIDTNCIFYSEWWLKTKRG